MGDKGVKSTKTGKWRREDVVDREEEGGVRIVKG